MQTPSVQGSLAHLPLVDQVIILSRAHAGLVAALTQTNATLSTLLADASDDQMVALADSLDGHPDVVRAIGAGVNATVLLQGLKAAEYLEDLPISGIADISEARAARGPQAWVAIARCLLNLSEITGRTNELWDSASPLERATFTQAVTYAKELLRE